MVYLNFLKDIYIWCR